MSNLSNAAKMAGEWWADRLDQQHADKREAFARAVALRIQLALDGNARWVWGESKPKNGDGKPVNFVYTQSDYDPCYLLLDAVHATVDPKCRGFMFSSRGLLPDKHGLVVYRDRMVPKEGYGKYRPEIEVPQ